VKKSITLVRIPSPEKSLKLSISHYGSAIKDITTYQEARNDDNVDENQDN
jgi:hypothetical protein